MKAVISTTYHDNYLYFLPIATWCWNKIDVDVIIFKPERKEDERIKLIGQVTKELRMRYKSYSFKSPEHKEATYSQCSRLFAACLDLPEDEVLITSDADMAVFGEYLKQKNADFDIFGYDLCPEKQYPICYISATVKAWREAMQINSRTYQQCLDDLLGDIEAEHFRGNYWGKDQETAFNKISQVNNKYLHGRARPGTQFADNRVDRDDINWRHYVNENLVDAHLWRPGYDGNNFNNILELLQMKYPTENFNWLIEYNEVYKKLL